jgi:hypothetical protein
MLLVEKTLSRQNHDITIVTATGPAHFYFDPCIPLNGLIKRLRAIREQFAMLLLVRNSMALFFMIFQKLSAWLSWLKDYTVLPCCIEAESVWSQLFYVLSYGNA